MSSSGAPQGPRNATPLLWRPTVPATGGPRVARAELGERGVRVAWARRRDCPRPQQDLTFLRRRSAAKQPVTLAAPRRCGAARARGHQFSAAPPPSRGGERRIAASRRAKLVLPTRTDRNRHRSTGARTRLTPSKITAPRVRSAGLRPAASQSPPRRRWCRDDPGAAAPSLGAAGRWEGGQGENHRRRAGGRVTVPSSDHHELTARGEEAKKRKAREG